MAFKEYSKNDFLYSGFASITDTYCNNTNFDDLIDSSCNIYGTDDISVILNGITYNVTPTNTINTIKKIADKFTEISPYIFSYNGDNQLIVESAKIMFATAGNNSASKFLGYNEDVVNHKLPYMFPNIIKTTYNDNKKVHEYKFDSSYNFGPVDIRADTTRPYYKIQTGSSMKIDTNGNVADPSYTSAYSLIEHLNYKKIGFATSSGQTLTASTTNNLYYKFEFVNLYRKIKVVDLMCEETSTLTDNKLTITIDNITYTYEFTQNSDNYTVSSGTKVAESMKGGGDVFRLFPDFTLTFTDGYRTTGKLVYSASKYVKSNEGKYYKLPYTLPTVYGTVSTNTSECISANQNKELCTNKSYADKLMALTTTHPGASERYENIRSFTSMSILNIFNLGIGIAVTGIFIAQTYK